MKNKQFEKPITKIAVMLMSCGTMAILLNATANIALEMSDRETHLAAIGLGVWLLGAVLYSVLC